MKTKMPPIATDVKKCKQTKIAWELSVNYWFDAFTYIYAPYDTWDVMYFILQVHLFLAGLIENYQILEWIRRFW